MPPYSPYGDTNKLETNIAIKLFVLKNSNCWKANKPTGMFDLLLKVASFRAHLLCIQHWKMGFNSDKMKQLYCV